MKKFDEIIQEAVKLENDLYFKIKGERFFKINRRCRDRLHLTCRQESSCTYSIRCKIECLNERVVLKELKQIHSCSVQSLSKRSKNDTILYVTSRNFWKDFPTCKDYLATKNVIKSVVAVGPAAVDGDALSSPVVYSSDDTSSLSRKDIDSLQSNDSSPTDDYFYPTSQDHLATQNVIKSVAAVGPAGDGDAAHYSLDNGWPRNALSSPVVYSSDNTSSRSCREIALPSKNSSIIDDHVYPTSRDVINSFSAVGSIGDGDAAHYSLDNGGPRSALSTPISGEVSSVLTHRISQFMAVLNPNNISEEQKGLVSSSLRYLLRYENGLPFIKELFLSYDVAECDKMLFELQMIRSIRFPKKQMHYPIRPIETPTNGKKRNSCYEFNEQDGDEVTYTDKPNQLLI